MSATALSGQGVRTTSCPVYRPELRPITPRARSRRGSCSRGASGRGNGSRRRAGAEAVPDGDSAKSSGAEIRANADDDSMIPRTRKGHERGKTKAAKSVSTEKKGVRLTECRERDR